MDKIQQTQLHVNGRNNWNDSGNSSAATSNLFALHDVTVAYKLGDGTIQTVLKEIDLQFAIGETVAIIGGNGSGKSTLLRVLAGLTPTSRGQVDRRGPSLIPIVFQNPDAQFVGETVYEDICFGLENMAVTREQMPQRVARALAEVGLSGFEHRLIEQLSGGQKQLVCIAAALALESSVLILDEPTAMLDPTAKDQVMTIVQRLKQMGTTVLWTTQQIDEVGYADRIVVLSAGQVMFTSTPEVFFYERSVAGGRVPCEQFGFRLPAAIELIHQLQARGMLTEERPVRQESCMEAVRRLCR